jgi:hypothetical protein
MLKRPHAPRSVDMRGNPNPSRHHRCPHLFMAVAAQPERLIRIVASTRCVTWWSDLALGSRRGGPDDHGWGMVPEPNE